MSKIVIVEDEKSIREELCLLLTGAGYSVAAIEDLDDAAQVLALAPRFC